MRYRWMSLIVALVMSLDLCAEKVMLLNDTTFHYHWGCYATSSVVKERLLAKGHSLETLGIREVARVGGDIPTTCEGFKDRRVFEAFSAENASLIEKLDACDFVVVNGEGTLHGTRPCPLRLLYLMYISKHFLSKPVHVINHSCYAEGNEAIYQLVYEHLDSVIIREEESLKEVQAMGINGELAFDCLPLYIRDHYRAKEPILERNLVISGSVAWEEAGVLEIIDFADKMEKEGYKIKVLTGAMANPAYDDELFIEFITQHMKAQWTHVDAKSVDEWLDTIDGASLMISGRYHNTIAALCLGVPYIAMNTVTSKLDAVLSFVGDEKTLSYSQQDLGICLVERAQKAIGSEPKEELESFCGLAEYNFNRVPEVSTSLLGKLVRFVCPRCF